MLLIGYMNVVAFSSGGTFPEVTAAGHCIYYIDMALSYRKPIMKQRSETLP